MTNRAGVTYTTSLIEQAVISMTYPGGSRAGRPIEVYECPHCHELGGANLMRKHIPRCPKIRRKPTYLERVCGAKYHGPGYITGAMGLMRPETPESSGEQ